MELRAVLVGLIGLVWIFLLTPSVLVQAQTVTARPDSVVVATPPVNPDANRIVKTEKDKGLSKPGRAALYSAILPGAGQFYNGHYWKIPVVYAVGGVLGYFIIDNNRRYNEYRRAYLHSLDNDPTTVPTIEIDGKKITNSSATVLLNGREYYRRNRDLSLILSVLAYGLNVMEANVGAHLNDFDVSDDISLNWQPGVQFSQSGLAPTPGVTLNFRFKN